MSIETRHHLMLCPEGLHVYTKTSSPKCFAPEGLHVYTKTLNEETTHGRHLHPTLRTHRIFR